MKWYETPYVSHRDWILDNLELLNLSSEESVAVLLIDFCNQNHITITREMLAQKLQCTPERVDRVLSVLTAKNYLRISALSTSVSFNLDQLFETEVAHEESALNADLFSLFESNLGRPLTSNDMMKISDLTKTYDSQLVVYALRQAVINGKISIPYVEKILRDWTSKNITVKRIEEGLSFEGK